MTTTQQQKIAEALERAEAANRAAEAVIEARDAKQAPAIVYEALTLTLEALAMCSSAGQLHALENLLPSAVYYTRVLGTLAADPFDAVHRIKLGSAIGVDSNER